MRLTADAAAPSETARRRFLTAMLMLTAEMTSGSATASKGRARLPESAARAADEATTGTNASLKSSIARAAHQGGRGSDEPIARL
jgi:hypothetical protein